MTTTYYGAVDKDGNPHAETPTSGGWVSDKLKTGEFTVTFNGAPSLPLPVVSVASNSLSGHGGGAKTFINVTDMGTNDDGRFYFGVTTNDQHGNLANRPFSFIAQAG